MSSLLGVRFSGPLEVYAHGFAHELARQGYLVSGAKGQLFLVAHLSRWLAERGLEPAVLNVPEVAEEFFAERRVAGYANYRTVKALMPLLVYLRALGVVAPPPVAPLTSAQALLERYRAYLTGERGLAATTARGYIDAVRGFVVVRERADGKLDLEQLTAAEVTAFVVEACSDQTRGSAKMLVTALRSLLGFLHVDGLLPESLVTAVPSAASWRLAGLPKGLEPAETARLLASCDRRTRTGRRDFAVLMLLTRLGMRAGEVAALELDDIAWRAGELLVRGKGPHHERLPLPDDAGKALVGYLQRGRPSTAAGRRVFVSVRAPHRPMTTGSVSALVYSAGMRAGIETAVRPHRLRHTAATGLLAAGAPLVEIGQLLRHRSQLTTAIYAKVDTEALRTLARPWPAGVA